MRYVLGCVHPARKMTGGGFDEPVEPPIEKPEEPPTPPLTEDLRTIKIEETIRAVVGTNDWRAIAYGNGKYVAVGFYGYTTTSMDGTNWTTPILAGGSRSSLYDMNAVAYGNGIFVAPYSSGVLMSNDGTNWTKVVISKTGCKWYSVTYNNGMFVIGGINSSGSGVNGFAATSIDGTNWTISTSSLGNCRRLTYGNGIYIGVGSKGYVSKSTDGITWTLKTVTSNSWYGIAYGKGTFVAVGSNGYITSSSDGNTWNDAQQIGTSSWLDVIYSNERFIAVGNKCYSTSIDGINWATPIELKDENGNTISSSVYGIIAVQ